VSALTTPPAAKGDYLSKAEDMIDAAPRVLADVGAGIVKGAGQTVNSISGLISKVAPGLVRPSDVAGLTTMETPTNTAQKVGVGIEGLAEWMATAEIGGAAFKGLSASERLGAVAKAAKFLEANPKTAQIIANSVMGTVQPLAHGATGTEALESGALAGLTSGAIEGAGAVKDALAPTTKTIAGVAVPVRAAVAEPGLVNKLAEFAANKPALQEFDVKQTQAAARDVIHNIAGETLKSSVKALDEQIVQNVFNNAAEVLQQPAAADVSAAAARAGRAIDLANHVQSALKAANPADFGETADVLRTKFLAPMYDAANKAGEYNKWAQEEEAAFRRGDVEAENAARAKKQAAFTQANGLGIDDPVNKLYTRLDDLERVHKVLATTLRPTPEAFVDDVTNGGKTIDPQIIDGLSLRKAVNRLAGDGTFAKAGVSQDTALKLQELGTLLERSKVQEGAKRGIYSASKAAGVGAGTAGVALGLDMILSHAATAGAATSAGAFALPVATVGAGTYSMNRLLGYLLTNPAALDYTLRAARTIVPPVASQAVTHVFNKDTGKVQPASQSAQPQ
jgi:hypothetical protein